MKLNLKKCNKCGKEKPLSEFYLRKDTNTYRNDCIKYNNEQSKQYYQENKQKQNQKSRIYHRKHKMDLIKYYKKWRKENPCKTIINNIFRRCNDKKSNDYKYYGGRGIKCLITTDELKELWFRDKAYNLKRPSIDRIDNDGDYTYENCRFIEMSENVGKMNKETKSLPILQYTKEGEFIKEWSSINEASRFYNVTNVAIGNMLHGKSKTSIGFIWKYKI